MAKEKIGLDRTKVKTLEKLKEAGFDTANKIKLLDGMLDHLRPSREVWER